MPTICISRIFPIGDLMSGQFLDLPVISQCEKNKIPSTRIRLDDFMGIELKLAIVDDPGKNFGR